MAAKCPQESFAALGVHEEDDFSLRVSCQLDFAADSVFPARKSLSHFCFTSEFLLLSCLMMGALDVTVMVAVKW